MPETIDVLDFVRAGAAPRGTAQQPEAIDIMEFVRGTSATSPAYQIGSTPQVTGATADFGPMPAADFSGLPPESQDHMGTGATREAVDAAVRDLYAQFPDKGDQFNTMDPRELAVLAVRQSMPPATRPMQIPDGPPGAETVLGEVARSFGNEVVQQFDLPGVPLVGPYLHRKAEEGQNYARPQGAAGFVGQTLGGLTGMASPKNFLETGGSFLAGGVIGKIAKPVIQRVASAVGPKIAAVFERALEEGGEEATFAVIQQAGREDWEGDPIGAAKRTLAAAGIGGTVGAVLGGGLAAARPGASGNVFDQIDSVGEQARQFVSPQQTAEGAQVARDASEAQARGRAAGVYDTGEPVEAAPVDYPFGSTIPVEPGQAGQPGQAQEQDGAVKINEETPPEAGIRGQKYGHKEETTGIRPDEGQTVPETPASLAAQMERLAAGERRAVLIPKGTPPPESVPNGMRTVPTSAGRFVYDPSELTASEILKAVKADSVGDILGYGTPRKPADAAGVVVVRDQQGNEIQAVATDEAAAPGVIAAAEKAARPTDSIRVEQPGEVIASRLAVQGQFRAAQERASVGPAGPNAAPVQPIGADLQAGSDKDAGINEKVEPEDAGKESHDLSSLSYAALRAKAKERGLTFPKTPSRQALIERLSASPAVPASRTPGAGADPSPPASRTARSRPAAPASASPGATQSTPAAASAARPSRSGTSAALPAAGRSASQTGAGAAGTRAASGDRIPDSIRGEVESAGYELVQDRLLTTEEANSLTDATGDQAVLEVPGDPQGRVVVVRPSAQSRPDASSSASQAPRQETTATAAPAAESSTSPTLTNPAASGDAPAGTTRSQSGTQADRPSPNPTREPWEMTREESLRSRLGVSREDAPNQLSGWKGRVDKADDYHRHVVASALSEGRPVPAEVLREYPDLVSRTSMSTETSGRSENVNTTLVEKARSVIRMGARSPHAEEIGSVGRAKKIIAESNTTQTPAPEVQQKGGKREITTDTLSSRAQTKIDEIKATRAKRQTKRGKDTGGGVVIQELIDAGAIAALRAVQAGDIAGRALTKHVKAAIAEIKSAADPKRVRRIAQALIRDMKVNGVVDPERFDSAVAGLYEAEPVKAKGTRAAIAQNAGPAPKEAKTLTRRQAEKAKYTYAAKVSKAVYREGQAEKAREFRQDVIPALRAKWSFRSMLESVGAQGRAFAAGEKAGWSRGRFSIAQAQAIRETLTEAVQNALPKSQHGKFIEAIRDVNSYPKLRKALDRLEREAVLFEGRKIAGKAGKEIRPKFLKALEPEERSDVEVAMAALRRARKAMTPEGQKGLTIDELVAFRDELESSLNAVRGILTESQNRDRVRIRGEDIETRALRGEVVDTLTKKPELAAGETPGDRNPAWATRAMRRRTNWESMMRDVDGWRKGGVGFNTFQRVLAGRREALRIDHEFSDRFGEIVKKNGYDSVGKFLAELSGTLGPAGQKTIDMTLGGYKKLTLGEAAYLYAASTDAGFLRRIRQGQKLQFRADATGEPFVITTGHLRVLATKIPRNVRAIIDEAKAAYDAHYFDRLSAVNKRLKGYHLTKEKGYWGIKLNRSFSDGKGTPQFWRRSIVRAMEEAGHMQERIGPGKTPILIGDFGTDILLRSKSAATVIGKAETTKLLARVFMHPDVVTAMGKTLGKEAVERMERRISLYSGGDLYREANDRIPRKVLSLWARGKTQLWLPTWVRNATAGLPRMMNEIGISRTSSGVLKPSWGAYQELRRYSPEARERWDSGGLGAFYHGGGMAESHARVGDAIKGSAANLFRVAAEGLRGNFKKAGEAAKGTGKAWESFLDALTIGNYFDAVPAIVAYKHFESVAPKNLSAEGKKRWAAQKAMRAHERTANTATTEYANDIQLDARDSTLVASFVPFTGDTAKAQTMLYEAWHKPGNRTTNVARTAAAIAAGALVSAAVTGLYQAAMGEKTERVKKGAMARFVSEIVSLVPIVGTQTAPFIQRKISSDKPVTPELQTPFSDLIDRAYGVASNIWDGLERLDDEKKKRVLTSSEKFMRALSEGGELAGNVAGAPLQYIKAVRRAITNWRE